MLVLGPLRMMTSMINPIMPPTPKYKLLTWPNDILTSGCEDIKEEEFGKDELKKLIVDMFDIMRDNGGIGLAAPQIGILKNIFVVDLSHFSNAKDFGFTTSRVFINPRPVGGPTDSELEEGCLSFPGVFQKVKRPDEVFVMAQDVDGTYFNEKAKGLYSHVILHEYDHLKGKTIFNYMSRLRKDMAKRKINKQKS